MWLFTSIRWAGDITIISMSDQPDERQEPSPADELRASLERLGTSQEITFGAILDRWHLRRPSPTSVRAVADALSESGIRAEPPLAPGLSPRTVVVLSLSGSGRAGRRRDRPAPDAGRMLLLLGSSLLVASLFLPWFSLGESGALSAGPSTALEWYGTLDVVLLLTAVAGLIGGLEPNTPRAISTAAVLLSVGSAIAVVVAVGSPPKPETFARQIEASPEAGPWFAVAACLLVAYGHLDALTSTPGRRRRGPSGAGSGRAR